MRQKPCAGATASNRVIGCRRRHDSIAGPARQLFADVPDHLEAAGYVVEGLGNLLANPAQRAAARGAGARSGVPRVFAWEMVRQWPAGRLLRFGCALDRGGDNRRGGGELLSLVLFQALDRQFERLGPARQFL